MKLRYLLPLTAVLAFAGCNQKSNLEAEQLAAERAALEQEKAALAAERAAAQQTALEQERARLESERAALEMEKAKLSNNREAQIAAEKNAQVAAERERRLAAEKKAAEEAAARRAAEVREREAQMTAEESRAAAEQARAAAEQAAAQAADEARSAQTVDFFYEALDPHGEWVQTDRYGYAFRPSTARDPRWRPYTDGGWIHTDYGWTWRSEEPFGWATYHYGRWARVPRLGWVWVPGSEWGPAWVSWRGSDDYIGWAPLPPDAWSSNGFNAAVEDYYDIGPGLYVFLRLADFGERSYRDRCIEPERNVTIVNQTVNVTKVSYRNVQNKMSVVNNGPDLAFLERASRTPIQRATVQRMPTAAAQPTRVEGNILKLAAPVLNALKPTTKPKEVKGEVKSSELDRGWREAKSEESRLREEAKKAARRAEDEERSPGRRTPPGAMSDKPAPVAPQPIRVTTPPPERRRLLEAMTPVPKPAATPIRPVKPIPSAEPAPREEAPAVPSTPAAAAPRRLTTPPIRPPGPPPGVVFPRGTPVPSADAPPPSASTPPPPLRPRAAPSQRRLPSTPAAAEPAVNSGAAEVKRPAVLQPSAPLSPRQLGNGPTDPAQKPERIAPGTLRPAEGAADVAKPPLQKFLQATPPPTALPPGEKPN